MGMSCPSHSAHPEGAKLNPNIRISATNGSDMTTSLGREDPEQGNDEADTQERHHVAVRLAPPPAQTPPGARGDAGRPPPGGTRRGPRGGALPGRSGTAAPPR